MNAADDVADADDGAPAAAAAAAGADADEEEEDPLLELTRKSPLPDTPSDGEGDEGPLCAPPSCRLPVRQHAARQRRELAPVLPAPLRGAVFERVDNEAQSL